MSKQKRPVDIADAIMLLKEHLAETTAKRSLPSRAMRVLEAYVIACDQCGLMQFEQRLRDLGVQVARNGEMIELALRQHAERLAAIEKSIKTNGIDKGKNEDNTAHD